ncbi:helicase PIF1 [Seminavis robusta]|uniref:ATP-dependent DNA helicase n=1 Tax=Seminavis robusta TaxID=568900 RepID=A0A9N8EX29_9STRA|nr:helicase PIF1 [Seminavis robusta]|eukprot:Sro2203_g318960.1 helicase PIF1 (821) ;mRNA; f:13169-15631
MSLITDSPIAMYQIKYQHKSTQQDDTAEYGHVEQAIKSLNGRVHDNNSKEAMCRICRAAFAHNKGNIIGPSLASFLTRNNSRFYFSHQFIYCPFRLLQKDQMQSTLKVTASGKCYFENQALHYLCRHDDLNNVCVKEFFERYDVKSMSSRKRSRKQDNGKWPFKADTGYFVHPSTERDDEGHPMNHNSEGVVERANCGFIQVPQWMFCDTAKFNCDMFQCTDGELNHAMDDYAKTVLAMLLPHRCLSDIKVRNARTDYPFAEKLCEVHQQDSFRKIQNQPPILFSDENCEFLQNIQNSAYNSLRYKMGGDDLSRNTEPYRPKDHSDDNFEEDEEGKEEEGPTIPEKSYEDVLNGLNTATRNDEDDQYLSQTLRGFNFTDIRKNGADNCEIDPKLPTPERTEDVATQEDTFVKVYVNFNVEGGTFRLQDKPPTPRLRELVEVFLTKRTSRIRAQVFERNPEAEIIEANGSVNSILEWAKAAQLDQVQKRAFECIVVSFLLTFYNDAGELDVEDATVESLSKQKCRCVKLNLRKLKGGKESQLICLVHGPGGSGKSTVINLVIAYAREYCELIEHPFTDRTIVVCAMSGVAATLLHGETWHSAAGANRSKKNVADNLCDEWKDTRMVIIDKISFASETDFKKMYEYTQILKENKFSPFGGLNMVFAGDYSQLEPVGRDPIYKHGDELPEFHMQLNTYIELDGRHRFRDDPEWGNRLFKFREGEATEEDIDYINTHCLISPQNIPPSDIQVACYGNKERDAINTAVFEEYCKNNQPVDGSVFKGAVMIFMDDLQMANQGGSLVYVRSNAVKRHFFSTCGESSF